MKFAISIIVCLLLTREISAAQEVPSAPPGPEIKSAVAPLVEQQPVKRWGMMIDLWAEANMNGVNRNDREGIKSDNEKLGEEISEQWYSILLLRPSYKMTDNSSLAVGQEFLHTFGGIDEQEKGVFQLRDTFFQVAHSDIARIGPVKLLGYIRPYLPTSERSQDPVVGQYAMIRSALTASLPLGDERFALSYTVEPRYFFSKNKSYESGRHEDGTPNWTVNEQYRIRHWLGLNANIEKFVGYQFVGLTSRYFYEDTDARTGVTLGRPQQDNLYWETGLGYSFNDNLTLLGGVYTETSNDIRRPDFAFFDDKEFLYFVEGTVTF